MFELPGLKNVKKVVIDASVVNGTSSPLYVYEEQSSAKRGVQ